MKKILLSCMVLGSVSAYASVIQGNPAKSIYKLTLSKEVAENSGDGVMSKSGFINCYEIGKRKPFKYKCDKINKSDSEQVYLKLLKKVDRSNSGDGVVQKSADVVCAEIGMSAPFTYRCEVL